MAEVDFYTNPMSRGQIARWALHEVGADYQEHLLTYGGTMKGPEYLAINPMGKVPCIVHEGRVVTEAAAICLYLGEAYPTAGLGLETLEEKAVGYRLSFFAAGPVEAAITNNAFGWGKDMGPEDQGRLGYGSYEQVCGVLSALFEARDYVCGKRFTMADVYTGGQVVWGLQFGIIPETPSLRAYADRLQAREAYRASKAIDGAHIEKMQADAG